MIKQLRGIWNYFYRRYGNVPSRSRSATAWTWDEQGLPIFHEELTADSRSSLTYAPYWQGTTLIAAACSRIPCNVRIVKDDGQSGQIDRRHPAQFALNKMANPLMTALVVREFIFWSAVRFGNGFCFIRRLGQTSGRMIELWPLDAGRIQQEVISDGELATPEMRYVYHDEYGEEWSFQPDEVLHLKGPSEDGFMGADITGMASKSLGLGLGAQRFQTGFFHQGQHVGTVITGSRIDDEQKAEQFLSQWDKRQAGLANAFRPALLKPGMSVHFPPSNAREQEVMDTRKFQRQDAASWLNLPPHKLGDDSRTSFNSLEQEEKNTLSQAFAPWLSRFESECKAKLLRPMEWRNDSRTIEHDESKLVPMSANDQADLDQKYIQSKVVTSHEVRAKRFPDLPDRQDEIDEFENPNTSTSSSAGAGSDADMQQPPPDDSEPAVIAARRAATAVNGNGSHK